MKTLKKIKLINWHLFNNQTIDIHKNTLVTGENGSGKSTFLDAIQFILVGGKVGAKFNAAASDDSKRKLEGYIRGKIGAENKLFLRNNDVITNVSLEFLDEEKNESYILGCLLELSQAGFLKEKFFYISLTKITDNLFIDNKIPRDFKNLRNYCLTKQIDIIFFDTQKQYKEKLSQFLKIDSKKYAKLLPKALGLRHLKLENFFFDFLLDDKPIDISYLKNNVMQLTKIEQQIQLDKEKINKLEEIINLGIKLQENQNQIHINELAEKLIYTKKIEIYLKDLTKKKEHLNTQVENLRKEKNNFRDKLYQLSEEIAILENSKKQDQQGQILSQREEQLENKENILMEKQEYIRQLFFSLEKEMKAYQLFLNNIKNPALEIALNYYEKHKEKINFDNFSHYLEDSLLVINSYKDKLLIKENELIKKREEYSEKLQNIQDKLYSFERNTKVYPQKITLLIEKLQQELFAKYHKEIIIKPLCELIEVTDEKWRNALEGLLISQKFDIIVDPIYFDDALTIYDKYKFELKLYGIGLVNTNKITHFTNLDDKSLAAKIQTEHKYARFFVNMAIGNVICVEKAQELKSFKRAITPTAMFYSNYTARQINPRNYQIPFIGNNSNALQVDILIEQKNNLNQENKILQDEISQTQKLLYLLKETKTEKILNDKSFAVKEDISQMKKEIKHLKENINNFTIDKTLEDTNKKLMQYKENKKVLNLEIENISEKIIEVRSKLQNIDNSIEENKQLLIKKEEEQKNNFQEQPTIIHQAQQKLQTLEIQFVGKTQNLIDYLHEQNEKIKTFQAKDYNQLTIFMNSYIRNFNFNEEAKIDNLIAFEKEIQKIKNNNLVIYEQEALELRKDAEISFREEFISKLKAAIESTQKQISELNQALDGKEFGTDSYKLIVKPIQDPEFKQYYDVIMLNEAIDKHTLFTKDLSKDKEEVLLELFARISSSRPEDEKLALQLLDYRNYLNYDIEIINQNGNKSFFSKVAKEKSGGETQVPFYIIIAAAFHQLLSKNKKINSGCIVLFDETFNKMDEARTETMMKFYTSLSIQLFITVTPQRVSDIYHYVDTSLAIVKNNDFSLIQSFVKKEENQIN